MASAGNGDDREDVDSDLPDRDTADEIASLQAILLDPAARRLDALQARLDDPEQRAADVGAVLPQVLLEHADDPRFARALTPQLEKAITTSVKRNPTPLADALFPVMGPAIRKAVSASLAAMIESLNRTLEHAISWRSLQWRLEALRTQKSFAEVVMIKTLLYRVEQVFLIDRKTGLLLQHVQPGSAAVQDADMVSGMLTAIRDFVHDSFKVADSESLEAMKVGELSVWVEAGPMAIVAAVIRGNAPRDVRPVLQEAVETIHLQFGHTLEHFSGDTAPFEGARPTLETCLTSQYRADERKPNSRFGWVLAGIAVVVLGLWVGLALRDRARLGRYVTALRAEPGLTVISAEKRGGKFVIDGMRDPLARDPQTLVAGTGLAADSVVGHWTPYQSLDAPLVLARAEKILQPPAGATLAVNHGVLTVAGNVSPEWVNEAKRLAPLIAGVNSFDPAGPMAAAVRDAIARIESIGLLFVKGSTQLTAAAGSDRSRLIGRLRDLETLAASTGATFEIRIVGHTDDDGAETSNQALSVSRAEAVKSMLASEKLPHLTLTTGGVGSREPAVTGKAEADLQKNRRVTLHVAQAGG